MISLRQYQDAVTVLGNPGKGLYHHYYDNSLDRYPSSLAEVTAVPGCRQLYLRLPWSVFEPKEGEFDWSRIDDLVQAWRPEGYGFSLRITCKETGTVYATPEWVRLAGAAGSFHQADPERGEAAWEPAWDDPVFLRCLETFLNTLGSRYDGAPWLDFVDIGSIGDWGEGHTHFGSRKAVSPDVRRRHIDLHRTAFPKTPVAVIDDFCAYQTGDPEATALFEYARARGCWLRDDSLGVNWWLNQGAAASWSVARPAWFAGTWPTAPTVVELEHYRLMKEDGNWRGLNGAERGADWLLQALDLCRPTWLGYHGWAAEWLSENPDLTRELANRVGYWLFPEEAVLPRRVTPGAAVSLQVCLYNRGWAPPYRPWEVTLRLTHDTTTLALPVVGLDARTCQPGTLTPLSGTVELPTDLAAGQWRAAIRFRDGSQPIRLACVAARQSSGGWLALGKMTVGM